MQMGPAKLFIRTLRVPVLAYEVHDVPGHYCQDGYRTQSTMFRLSRDDNEAKEILKKSGMTFEVVDLSEGRGGKKLAAWLRGVRRTPTLLVEGDHRKREGVAAILDYVNTHNRDNQAGT